MLSFSFSFIKSSFFLLKFGWLFNGYIINLREGEEKDQAKGMCFKKYFSMCPKGGKIKLP